MLEYHLTNTSVTVELLILSGGITVTGRTPTVLIRNRDTGNYFDFASNTFTSTTTSATAVLNSAIEGLYRYTWDVSGQFNSATLLMFEYHDATSAAIDEVMFYKAPNLRVSGGGGGPITVKGIWTAKQKKKLLEDIKDIKEKIDGLKEQTILLLRRILGKKTLQKEDLKFITDLRRTDLDMWKEVLEIFKLNENATDKDLINKIKEWMASEEDSKKELIKLLDEKIDKKKEPKIEEEGEEE